LTAKFYGVEPEDVGVCRSQGDDNINLIVRKYSAKFAEILGQIWEGLGLELDKPPEAVPVESAKWLSSRF